MIIKIGTRKSKLALIQSQLVSKALKDKFNNIETEFIHITTKGDIVLDRPLEKIGGKGVFIDEIEKEMLNGEIDIAVHSAKDLPVEIADGTLICSVLKRADAHDILVTNKYAELPEDPVIGTSSTRRSKGVHKIFQNAIIKDIRGNVDTRLGKLADGQYDGIILAAAGLSRLGAFEDERFEFSEIPFETIVPAPCQGIIAVQARSCESVNILSGINDADTYRCFETERYILKLLNSGCSSPTGAVSCINGNVITLTVTKDQKRILTDSASVEERFDLAERLISRL